MSYNHTGVVCVLIVGNRQTTSYHLLLHCEIANTLQNDFSTELRQLGLQSPYIVAVQIGREKICKSQVHNGRTYELRLFNSRPCSFGQPPQILMDGVFFTIFMPLFLFLVQCSPSRLLVYYFFFIRTVSRIASRLIPRLHSPGKEFSASAPRVI